MSDQNATPAAADPLNTGPLDGEQARRVLQAAVERAEQGDYGGASVLYSRVVGHREAIIHTYALLGLADARYRLDDEEGALQCWIVATQAPETPISWQAWVALAGARVRQEDLPAAARAYREAERRAPADERPAIAARLGWLNKEMGHSLTAQRYFGRARSGVFSPLMTWAILAITSAISLWILFTPGAGQQALTLLALDKDAVRDGEVWRLLTVTLVHANLIHLGFNMFALYIVGPIVEGLYGRVLFLAFYLLSAAAGSVASYLITPGVSVGASGAVFGLFGLLLLSTWIHKPALGRQARALTSQIAFLIVINLAIGFGAGAGLGVSIDNAAHVGGLVAGSWLGFAIAPRGTAGLVAVAQRLPAGVGQGGGSVNLLRLAAMLAVVVVVLVGLSLTPLWA